MKKLLIRNICQPPDTNPYGTGHGAWIAKQVAHGGIYYSMMVSGGDAVLAEIQLKYKSPMHVGKFICVYGSIKEIKGSKMVFSLEGKRVEKNQKEIIVAEGTLTYVAVNEKGKPRKFKSNLK